MTKTQETKTADALLQRPKTIDLGGKSYEVAPPTLATLILVSEELSKLPPELLAAPSEEESVTISALRSAQHAHGLSRAIARLILGAPTPFPSLLERLLDHFRPDPTERLARQLAASSSPRALAVAFVQLTEQLEVGDFFALTAFLAALRVTRPTREAEATPTAPGR